jgi:hypothetical protein
MPTDGSPFQLLKPMLQRASKNPIPTIDLKISLKKADRRFLLVVVPIRPEWYTERQEGKLLLNG